MATPSSLFNTFYSTIATYLEFLFGLIISVLVARSLGPSEFGQYGYFMWLSSLLITMVSGGISLAGIKYIAEHKLQAEGNDVYAVDKYLRRLLLNRGCYFLILSLEIVYLINFYKLVDIEAGLIYVVLTASIVKSFQMYNVSILKGFEDFKSLALLNGVVSPVNLIIVLCCVFFQQKLPTFVFVYLLVCCIYWMISWYLYKNKMAKMVSPIQPGFRVTSKISRQITTASWISILNFIVLRQSEMFFLNIYASADSMAFFSVSFTLASAAMTLVPGVYSAILMPMMTRLAKQEAVQVEQQLKLSLRYVFQLIVGLIFPVCYFAEEIFSFLYGVQYLDAVYPFQIILVAVAIKTLLECTNAYLWGSDNAALILKLTVIGGVVTLLMDFFLIKHYQLDGALFAFFGSTLLFVILNFVYILRKVESKFDWFMFCRILFAGAMALVIISPISRLIPSIFGAIVGSGLSVLVYIILLVCLRSLSLEDILGLKKLNARFLRIYLFDKMFLYIENKRLYL